jgi:hypothetical protein
MTYSQNIPPDSLLSFGKNRKIEKIKRKENIISIFFFGEHFKLSIFHPEQQPCRNNRSRSMQLCVQQMN